MLSISKLLYEFIKLVIESSWKQSNQLQFKEIIQIYLNPKHPTEISHKWGAGFSEEELACVINVYDDSIELILLRNLEFKKYQFIVNIGNFEVLT